jgi:hypothetical protein
MYVQAVVTIAKVDRYHVRFTPLAKSNTTNHSLIHDFINLQLISNLFVASSQFFYSSYRAALPVVLGLRSYLRLFAVFKWSAKVPHYDLRIILSLAGLQRLP